MAAGVIVDFLLDFLFGVAQWVVGLLPEANYDNVGNMPGASGLSFVAALRAFSFVDYILPVSNGFLLLMYFKVGNAIAIALYRFILRMKPW